MFDRRSRRIASLRRRAAASLLVEVDRASRFAILIAFTIHLQNAADVGRISSETSGVVTRLFGEKLTLVLHLTVG